MIVHVSALQEIATRLTKAPVYDYPTIAWDFSYTDACQVTTTMRVALSGQLTCVAVQSGALTVQLGSMSAAEARSGSRRLTELGTINLQSNTVETAHAELLEDARKSARAAHASFTLEEIKYFLSTAQPTILFHVYKALYAGRPSDVILLESRFYGRI
jgi:hypothetical protein